MENYSSNEKLENDKLSIELGKKNSAEDSARKLRLFALKKMKGINRTRIMTISI